MEFRPYYPRRKGRYTSISLIRVRNSRDPEPDLLDLLGSLSKGARDLFLEIKRNMDYRTYTATLPNKNLPRSEINRRSRAIDELRRAGNGLACRVPTKGVTSVAGVDQGFRPGTFMLSPYYIYPNHLYEKEIQNVWNQSISHNWNQGRRVNTPSVSAEPDVAEATAEEEKPKELLLKQPSKSSVACDENT
ncbi:hypothetical protein EDB94_4135 [Marinobacter sp. 3-2]|jgi:hypothetical protein|uniref:hypothetical protein n=1 Tax=Marinobacter sp. 3-2 TaxID=2485141 RepID=UPI000D382011|nr:hypothetical protein [Marinobacter sp. 3-2]ROQ37939.1 hypothetical protein EDB94_4135 [Marinobacter sp. 3-2]